MQHIKLDAIDSTNDFLKDLAVREPIANFTVVTAETQTKGKGQMGAVWKSEPGKNLTMSVLMIDVIQNQQRLFDLNILVSVAILETLKEYQVPQLTVKWPNDIMSGVKKIGGVLIENSIKSNGSIYSVVGLGLNINQTDFQNLPNASSLALVCGRTFDKQQILESLVQNMKFYESVLHTDFSSIARAYADKLFRKGQPTAFESRNGRRFMGIIEKVLEDGRLEIQLEDDSFAVFSLKEIKMLY